MNKHIKIGVDYHGVITSNPSFFKTFNELALRDNIEIVIITGARKKDVEHYLKEHEIPYTSVWSLLDYFEKQNLVTFYDNGSFHVQDELWNKAKADYCKKEKIDLHIDDSLLYGTYFQTPFCLYDITKQDCNLISQNIHINFKQTASKVLQDIKKHLTKFN